MFLADVIKLPLEDFWVVETDICVCETALLPLMSLCNPLKYFFYPFILFYFISFHFCLVDCCVFSIPPNQKDLTNQPLGLCSASQQSAINGLILSPFSNCLV